MDAGMSEEQPKAESDYIGQLVRACTLSIVNGFPKVTITTDGKLPRSFPRCELLSVNPQGAHNYSADPVKVLGWIHTQTMRGAPCS